MNSSAERNDSLDRALKLGKERHPQAPAEHHLAFSNTVAYLVTGWVGGFGEPSMRQNLAYKVARQSKSKGCFEFDEAVAAVEEACYGPLTIEHAKVMLEEYCAGDAPGEKETAERLILLHQARN